MDLYLPKESIKQRLDRKSLPKFNNIIKERLESISNFNITGKQYIIADGPPYANGDLHLGHFLNKTLKDLVLKNKLTQGYNVKYSFGWDCHGLPIESKAKTQEGSLLRNCKNIATTYQKKQEDTLSLFGLYSTESKYLTMSQKFIDRELALYAKLESTGCVFNKEKPIWYSPSLACVLANAEIEYKTIDINTIYFTLLAGDAELLVWTTTEWTIAGNQAVCVNPNIQYVITNKNLICSEKFAIQEGVAYDLVDITKIGTYINHNGDECPVLFDEYVKDEQTGIVHLAGGHGDDDFRILTKNGIQPKNAVEVTELQKHIDTYKLDDCYVYKREVLQSSQPMDWRTHRPMYKVLTMQLYVNIDHEKVIKTAKNIKLAGKVRKRLLEMALAREDWCISRQRKWGVRIPESSDIFDVWFDSGSVFTMYDTPADIYIEGNDQYRGWFQSSLVLASLVGKIPAKQIVSHGFILDEFNEKLAKSKGNSTSLVDLYDKYGPDVLRLWVILTNYKMDMVISEASLKSASKQYFKIRNYVRYYVNNLHIGSYDASKVDEPLRKIFDDLILVIKKHLDQLEFNKAFLKLMDLLRKVAKEFTLNEKNKFYESSLSNPYRIKKENEFHYLLTILEPLLFIFTPFLWAEIYDKFKK